jgi:hypothetical protein
MKADTVNLLIGEIQALRGIQKSIQDRLWAVEQTVLSKPELATVYLQKLADRTRDPQSMLPLTGLADLQRALLQDQNS